MMRTKQDNSSSKNVIFPNSWVAPVPPPPPPPPPLLVSAIVATVRLRPFLLGVQRNNKSKDNSSNYIVVLVSPMNPILLDLSIKEEGVLLGGNSRSHIKPRGKSPLVRAHTNFPDPLYKQNRANVAIDRHTCIAIKRYGLVAQESRQNQQNHRSESSLFLILLCTCSCLAFWLFP
mmetsp:Transcript_17434/g.33086  ORF Transcript_17434/g.33086 Transcript_17434/m.33086 type:complete len:175 (-) Transcript_17434:557-1081(-)